MGFAKKYADREYYRTLFLGFGTWGVIYLAALAVAQPLERPQRWESQFQGFRPAVVFWDSSATIVDRNLDRRTYNPGLNLKCEDRDIMHVRLTPGDNRVLRIIFSTFPSQDAHFEVLDVTNATQQFLGRVEGYCLEIPGDGFLYGSGHINNTFDQKRKYSVTTHSVREVQQPFYHVGLKSKCNRRITLYSTEQFAKSARTSSVTDSDSVVSILQPGESLEVILSAEPNLYLIRDHRGLLGWAEITNVLREAPDINDLCFVGD